MLRLTIALVLLATPLLADGPGAPPPDPRVGPPVVIPHTPTIRQLHPTNPCLWRWPDSNSNHWNAFPECHNPDTSGGERPNTPPGTPPDDEPDDPKDPPDDPKDPPGDYCEPKDRPTRGGNPGNDKDVGNAGERPNGRGDWGGGNRGRSR